MLLISVQTCVCLDGVFLKRAPPGFKGVAKMLWYRCGQATHSSKGEEPEATAIIGHGP